MATNDPTIDPFTPTRIFHREFLQSDPFRRYNAHAVGVGWKIVNGEQTTQPALRVYVARKLADADVPTDHRIPAQFQWTAPGAQQPTTILTDVIEAKPSRPLAIDHESRTRPVPGGIGGSAMASGTLGAWVWDTLDDSIVMLSNAHVLGYQAGVPVLQPAKVNGGLDPTDRIGEVKRSVAVTPVAGPAPWPEEQCNFVDAAIGSVDQASIAELSVLEVGPGIFATEVAAIGMLVEMSGKTTGHTTGIVDDIDYAAAYQTMLGPGNWQIVGYCDLIRIIPTAPTTTVAISGDSGSAAFASDPDSAIKPAVGLVAWGNGGEEAIAAKIQNVFAELRVDVLCSGGFAAFFDALAEDDHDPQAALAAATFESRTPRSAGLLRMSNGITRDVQRRLRRSSTGATIVDLVQRHRAEILTALLGDGDVRRATIAAVRPILRGAVSTDALFARSVSTKDLARLGHGLDVWAAKCSQQLASELGDLRRNLRLDTCADRQIATIIGEESTTCQTS